jgi:transposase InsO family protein
LKHGSITLTNDGFFYIVCSDQHLSYFRPRTVLTDGTVIVATPEIFNSDQGVQFTSTNFTKRLEAARIRISWDGKGRAFDNIFVERLWRTVKYEEVFLKDYQTVPEAVSNLRDYFTFDNQERFHQALGYQTPAQVYTGAHHLVGQLRAQRQHAEQQGGNL